MGTPGKREGDAGYIEYIREPARADPNAVPARHDTLVTSIIRTGKPWSCAAFIAPAIWMI